METFLDETFLPETTPNGDENPAPKIRGNFRRSQAQFFGQIFGDFECQKSEVIRIAIAVLREP
jgi:hypothetical protein